MTGPGFIDGFEADTPFWVGRVLFGILHHFVPLLEEGMALALDNAFIFVKEQTGVEMAALGAALEHIAIGQTLDLLAVVAEAAHEFVVEREEVAGGTGVALAAGAAS